MGRKKKNKLKKNNTRKTFYQSIILISIGTFISLGYIFSEKIGILGSSFMHVLVGTMGNMTIVISLAVIVFGCYAFIEKANRRKSFYFGSILILISLFIIFEIPYISIFSIEGIGKAYIIQTGGGSIGFIISGAIYSLIGIIGLFIILILFLLIGATLLINSIKKLYDIKEASKGKIKDYHSKVKIKRAMERKEKQRSKHEEKRVDSISKSNYDVRDRAIIFESMLEKNDFRNASDKIDKDLISNNGFNDVQEIGNKKFDPKAFNAELLNDEIKSRSIPIGVDGFRHISKKNSKWVLPPINLLKELPLTNQRDKNEEVKRNIRVLEDTLMSFKIKIEVNNVSSGPSITRYEAKLAPGTKVSKIQNLGEDLALALAATSVRIEAPIPGKSAVGFEIPNKIVSPVSFREVILNNKLSNKEKPLTFALGKDITGKVITTSLVEMPHLLIAGSTGSGKSVCLNTLICSFLYRYTPDEVKFLMVDPKKVELSVYNDIPHLVAPVVTDAKKAATALKWMVNEMEERYSQLSSKGVRDIKMYNEICKKEEKMPYIVVIIDELADLMMAAPGDVETSICRIAQKARAAGIHLIVATQRPSVNVITGDIKSNIPRRIAFAVFSQIDARTILDTGGAEKLLGRGDMLFSESGGKLVRIQGAFISDEETAKVTEFLKYQGLPEYLEGCEVLDKEEVIDEVKSKLSEPLLKDAAKLVLENNQASISTLQRKLKIGYSRAARIIDLLEEMGLVGPFVGTKSREITGNWEDFQRMFGD